MIRLINRNIHLVVMKTSILVGGQAVIEGVMMRVPGAYATALRLKSGKIIFQKHLFQSAIKKDSWKNTPILRGMFHLYESMKIGYQTLDWSAAVYEEEHNKSLAPPSTWTKTMDYIGNFIGAYC